jgi:GrpB-like predicted nucleotidyltransferase (UPF0157 family)
MTDDLNNLSVQELGILFPVIIADYKSEWPDLYQFEKQKIIASIGTESIYAIEHIGSTAVPGLCAKPTIDILIEINEDTNPELLIERLQRISYQFIPKPENPPPNMMFAKGYTMNGITGQTYHIHIRYSGDCDEIVFRDYLIGNPEMANDYATLKRRLSVDFKNNREKYTESKGAFIKKVIQKAREKI